MRAGLRGNDVLSCKAFRFIGILYSTGVKLQSVLLAEYFWKEEPKKVIVL